MSLIPFDTLPDDARLWCFGASRAPDASTAELLSDSMRAFIAEWTAHRRDLHAGFDWLHGRFLLIGVDESRAGASGCSIDALTGHLKRLGAELDVDLLDAMPVWFRGTAGDIRMVSRADFSDLAAQGVVTTDTPVFDLTLTRLGDARAGGLETRAGSAWQRSLLASD